MPAPAVTPSTDLVAKYGRPGPRYTSYPAVPYWPAEYPLSSWRAALAELGEAARTDPRHSVSVYVHVPKTAVEYAERVEQGCSPVVGGMHLDDDDVLREAVIAALMCYGEVDLAALARERGVDLLASPTTRAGLDELAADRLVELHEGKLRVTELGRHFVRNVAMTFDAYLGRPPTMHGGEVPVRFSRTV